MSKAKKVTYKELMSRIDFIMEKMIQFEKGLDYVHSLVISYIECNDHQTKLRDFLKKETENEQTDRSSNKTDRSNQSGDKSSNKPSDKPGESTNKKRSKDTA